MKPGDWISFPHKVFKSQNVYTQVKEFVLHNTSDDPHMTTTSLDRVYRRDFVRKLDCDEMGNYIPYSGKTLYLQEYNTILVSLFILFLTLILI